MFRRATARDKRGDVARCAADIKAAPPPPPEDKAVRKLLEKNKRDAQKIKDKERKMAARMFA